MTKSVFTTDYNQLRELLVNCRKDQGLLQMAVAARLSKPQSFVSKYESGERRLDVIEFIQVVQALGEDPLLLLKRLINNGKHK